MRAHANECWAVLCHYWEALHVERQGKYSVERLYSLKLHSERTSLIRVLLVVILTPIPCIVTTILADLIPLAPPELGLTHSYMFWIRATWICWYISFTVVIQCRHFIPRLPIPLAQALGVSTFITATSIAATFGLAEAIGFPLPFLQVMITPGWFVGLVISIVFVWGKHFKSDPRMKREMVHYVLIVTAQTCMTYVYPAYMFVFRMLSGPSQVVFALFLPAIKSFLKNVMNYLLRDLEDAKPEFIIFNVEVFHALFVACCMQSASSYRTTIILMITDFLFAGLAIRKITVAIRTLDVLVSGNSQEDDEDEAMKKSERIRGLSHVEAAIFLLCSDPKLQLDGTIRIRAKRAHNSIKPTVQSMVMAPTKQLSTPIIGIGGAGKGSKTNVVPLDGMSKPIKVVPPRVFASRASTGQQVAIFSKSDENQNPERATKPSEIESRPSPAKAQRTMTRLSAQILPTTLSDKEKDALLALSDTIKAEYVEQVLHILHWTEFLLLVEFVEVIIPIVYCVYLSVAYHLPNKVYYAQLRDTDDTKFRASIGNILLYAMLEAISLAFLGLILRHKLKLKLMRQLTFVLESQWQQVQSKLILWTAFAIQTPLDHVGMDFSFQFAWLKKNHEVGE